MNTEQAPTIKEALTTTENTTFDLEWAKRGMVVHIIYAKDKESKALSTFAAKRLHEIAIMIRGKWIKDFLGSYDLEKLLTFQEDYEVRMATRAECDAAGVEYIEPPLNSEDESAMLVIAHLNGYEAGKKNAEARIKDLEDGIRNLFKFYGEGLSDDETSPAYERLFKLIGIEV